MVQGAEGQTAEHLFRADQFGGNGADGAVTAPGDDDPAAGARRPPRQGDDLLAVSCEANIRFQTSRLKDFRQLFPGGLFIVCAGTDIDNDLQLRERDHTLSPSSKRFLQRYLESCNSGSTSPCSRTGGRFFQRRAVSTAVRQIVSQPKPSAIAASTSL